jgi:sulfotransferase family protein
MSNFDKPVFVLSSSWRSGSTLVQRYVTASGEVLVWGETGGALDALRDALSGWEQITAPSAGRFAGGIGGGKGEEAFRAFVAAPKSEHAGQWIANLTPPYADIAVELRAMLLKVYGVRAGELGYPRFGIKETRCDLTTARCLRTLFPDAKFIFLVRDPLAVMLSIKRRNWMGRPPGHATLRYYAEHWRLRSAQFRDADFGITLRYEDFVANAALRDKLMDYLEIDARPPADFAETSQVDWVTRDNSDLSRWERGLLRHWLGGEMRQWGY